MPVLDGGDAEPAGVECGQRDPHPVALGADALVGRDPGVVEEDLGGDVAGQPHLLLGGAEGHAGRVRRDDERAQPAGRVVARAGEEDVVVGARAVADPLLGAGDDVRVAVEPGPGLDAADVGARLRLGQAVGAEPVAAQHPRQPGRALLVGGVGSDHGCGQGVHAHADRDARPDRGDLLDDLQVDLVRLAAPAELLGERQAQQPGLAQQGVRRRRELARLLRVVDLRRELLGHQLAGQLEERLGLLGRQQAVDGGRHSPIVGRPYDRWLRRSRRDRHETAAGLVTGLTALLNHRRASVPTGSTRSPAAGRGRARRSRRPRRRRWSAG